MDAKKMNSFKKSIFKIYNEINKEIYGYGVIELKVHILDDMVICIDKHNRVPALIKLEESNPKLKQSVDYALFVEFKNDIKKQIMEKYDIEPLALLRDYDCTYHVAMTTIVLGEENLEKLLS